MSCDDYSDCHSLDNGREVVIHDDNVSRLLGDLRASNAHGQADIRLLQTNKWPF